MPDCPCTMPMHNVYVRYLAYRTHYFIKYVHFIYLCNDYYKHCLCPSLSGYRTATCSPGQIACPVRDQDVCVSNMFACDGWFDCDNGMDELGCPTVTTIPGTTPDQNVGSCKDNEVGWSKMIWCLKQWFATFLTSRTGKALKQKQEAGKFINTPHVCNFKCNIGSFISWCVFEIRHYTWFCWSFCKAKLVKSC